MIDPYRTAHLFPPSPRRRLQGPGGGAFALLVLAACASSAPAAPAMTETQKHEAADATYFGDMMRCRDKKQYPTLAVSDACLDATRKKWHRLPDGGADGTLDGGSL